MGRDQGEQDADENGRTRAGDFLLKISFKSDLYSNRKPEVNYGFNE